MKRKRVEWSVGYDDQMPRPQMRSHRLDQFLVQSFQMRPGGAQQGLFELLRVGHTHAKFRKLEPEQMQPMGDVRDVREGGDFNGFACYDRRHQPVPSRIVFDQSGVGWEGGLQSSQ